VARLESSPSGLSSGHSQYNQLNTARETFKQPGAKKNLPGAKKNLPGAKKNQPGANFFLRGAD
jgi:hypothetical protein